MQSAYTKILAMSVSNDGLDEVHIFAHLYEASGREFLVLKNFFLKIQRDLGQALTLVYQLIERHNVSFPLIFLISSKDAPEHTPRIRKIIRRYSCGGLWLNPMIKFNLTTLEPFIRLTYDN